MKYVGGKSGLLERGLGRTISTRAKDSSRFFDLFSGSGAVSHFVANKIGLPVISSDLQEYSRALSAAVVERTVALDQSPLMDTWLLPTQLSLLADDRYKRWSENSIPNTVEHVLQARQTCQREATHGEAIIRSYGGHYFSPLQALSLQKLHASLPICLKDVALAALIRAASRCAASPGHTAQPFQPSATSLPFIRNAWRRDVLVEAASASEKISELYSASDGGRAFIGDALEVAHQLREGDLVFMDPPYSDFQYSRFYHVLEGVAIGGFQEVAGAGRAPIRELRASSSFSRKASAQDSLSQLVRKSLRAGAKVIVTLPAGTASNGLDHAQLVADFGLDARVTVDRIPAVHSTLGGRAATPRGARRQIDECVVSLMPS